ncbi:MAG: thiamine monophosphate kinase [Variovorax sp.]|nr:thiamine monophosphate kinase [Variovorax sp.]
MSATGTLGEFGLIERYFTRRGRPAASARPEGSSRVALGVGDDCALLAPAPGMQLAISTDMLVEGRHFLSTVDPARLGHKALAVNLSDLAACGARPVAFTLALALPSVEEGWLAGFSRGLFALADAHSCELVGGDTTRGPLNISITVFGELPAGSALLRSGARAGDDLWASGTLGDARLALEAFRGTLVLPSALFEMARARMEQPTPRVALGQALRGIASAAVDVSDGLLGDLRHILEASRVGARVDADAAIELIAANAHPAGGEARLDMETLRRCALSGGDDYELLFTAPPDLRQAVEQAGRASATPVARIGRIEAEPGVRVVDRAGAPVAQRFTSFDHFG